MLPNRGNGTYRLYAYAYDVDGHQTLLGSKAIRGDERDGDEAVWVDRHAWAGGDGFGEWVRELRVGGDAAAGAIAVDGSTIMVYIDGQAMGHPVYNNYRSDIATLFPGLANSNGAVGYYDDRHDGAGERDAHDCVGRDGQPGQRRGHRLPLLLGAELSSFTRQ